MKKLIWILVMFFCLALLSYKGFFYFDRKAESEQITRHKNANRLSAEELSKIEEGDFILRRGFGFFSDYVSTTLNSGTIDVTHAGIIIKKNKALFVVHSLSSDVTPVDGVQIQPLDVFLQASHPGKIIITRLRGCSAASGREIATLAQEYLSRGIPFDHNGNYDDDKELYCTELIWKILEKDLKLVVLPKEAGQRKKFFYSMNPMYDTSYFDIKVNQYSALKKNAAATAAF